MTLTQYIDAILNGETVESVEMGGISPDYENAIQHLAFCIMVRLKYQEPPQDAAERNRIVAAALSDAVDVLGRFYGYSGAQAGAAGNLAGLFWALGPTAALDKMRAQDMTRIIKVHLIFNITSSVKLRTRVILRNSRDNIFNISCVS